MDRHRAQRGVGGDRDRHRGVDPRQLLDRQGVGEGVGAPAPRLLGERDSHQPQLSHLRHQLVGEALLAIELLCHRRDLLACEVAHRVAEQPLLVCGLEIDAGSLELQRLRLQELLEREAAQLAAVAGLLVAAERGQRIERPPVYLHLAGPEAATHAQRPLRIA